MEVKQVREDTISKNVETNTATCFRSFQKFEAKPYNISKNLNFHMKPT